MTGSNSQDQNQIRAPDAAGIAAALAIIGDGGCVAVPTETVYGLAADATNEQAVAGIYAAKSRPGFNPLIIHVASLDMAQSIGHFDHSARLLAELYWPGPLTIVVPRRADCPVAHAATAGLETIAIRCPAHPVMQALIAAAGRPLAAPSANASGGVSPTTAAHVLASLGARVPLILDGGACSEGLESTIVAIGADALTLLRPGSITAEMIFLAAGLQLDEHDGGRITAPGQLESHYAPGKPVLLNCTVPPVDAFVIGFGPGQCDFQLSEVSDVAEAARNLYAALHAGAASHMARIAVSPIPNHGAGIAINDRLARAAA